MGESWLYHYFPTELALPWPVFKPLCNLPACPDTQRNKLSLQTRFHPSVTRNEIYSLLMRNGTKKKSQTLFDRLNKTEKFYSHSMKTNFICHSDSQRSQIMFSPLLKSPLTNSSLDKVGDARSIKRTSSIKQQIRDREKKEKNPVSMRTGNSCFIESSSNPKSPKCPTWDDNYRGKWSNFFFWKITQVQDENFHGLWDTMKNSNHHSSSKFTANNINDERKKKFVSIKLIHGEIMGKSKKGRWRGGKRKGEVEK